ncbi:GNAT family N-acetyltransferase [Geobacter pelophilus]|uniref:GNAT family N-acetyltransferase n=1 Tax=Geoanaerobacter pelophilus TaxID=60036 RepID=A0AAW4L4Y8_9BACT|nr:GNAT family N-acetyltransferase [Geoanaerobacter pelophilus]MBT0665953.1 GNAT family N-acetyltransferase [Geoanaerobacter pelophilus]
MIVDSFDQSEIELFLDLAAAEGWISDQWELAFLLKAFPQGCFVARETGGVPVAFITSVAYRNSGWIGNLIVHQDFRRRGIASLLMTKCMESLGLTGVRTIWLTASPSGAPLYKGLGFQTIDHVARWYLNRSFAVSPETAASEQGFQELLCHDSVGWGDDRSAICHEKLRLGKLFMDGGSSLIIHNTGTHSYIGPWVGGSELCAERLLARIYSRLTDNGATCLDVPVGNPWSKAMLEKFGFVCSGETVLMYHGDIPDYRPDTIYALASMGSIG